MKNQLYFRCLVAFLFVQLGYSQDFMRLGIAHDFDNDKVVQTFTFDLNRTEDIKEKSGKYLIYLGSNVFVCPTIDINIGDGIKTSDNNVLFQVNVVRKWFGTPNAVLDAATQISRVTAVNQAFEFVPSFNADKTFAEKMGYAQLKYTWNFLASRAQTVPAPAVLSDRLLSFGLAANTGYRFSKTYDEEKLYATAGVILEYKYQLLKTKIPNMNFKLSANYYYLISELEALTNDDFAGSLKASIDKKLYNTVFLELSYKYGNNNPTYSYVNVVELSAKLRI